MLLNSSRVLFSAFLELETIFVIVQPTKYTKKHEKIIRLIFYILSLDND